MTPSFIPETDKLSSKPKLWSFQTLHLLPKFSILSMSTLYLLSQNCPSIRDNHWY